VRTVGPMEPGYANAYSRANVHFASWSRQQHPAEWRRFLDAELALLPPGTKRRTPPAVPPPAEVIDPPQMTIDERRAAFQADQKARRAAAIVDRSNSLRRDANLRLMDQQSNELRLRLEKIREEKARSAAYYAAELDEP